MNGFLSRVFVICLAIDVVATPAPCADVSYSQIQSLAVEALRNGDVAFARPWAKPARGILWAKDVGPGPSGEAEFFLDYWFNPDEPAKAALTDQLAIEIRRQYLFGRESNRRIMEPYYARMEEIVSGELSNVQRAGDEVQIERQLADSRRKQHETLMTGIEECARNMGLEGAFFEPGIDDGTVWFDRIFALDLPHQGQITFGQVDAALDKAIRDRAIKFDKPTAPIENGTLWVTDVVLWVEWVRKLEPIEEVVVEEAKIKLRRSYLFQRARNRAIMQPVHDQMEVLVREQLESLRQAGTASAIARASQAATNAVDDVSEDAMSEDEPSRSAFGRKLDSVLLSGLRRCAESGRLRLEYTRHAMQAMAEPARVKLLAPRGTTIEFVNNLDHKLWALTGKSEDDYQWQTYTAGETVNLLGGYWFRVTYPNGQRVSFYKKVGVNDTELRFPLR